jgi:hypothetical protein
VIVLASLVDWGALGKVVLYAFVSAIGVTTVFSVGIVGLVRFDEGRRIGGGAVGYAVLALLCGLIVLAVVVEAIIVMTNK